MNAGWEQSEGEHGLKQGTGEEAPAVLVLAWEVAGSVRALAVARWQRSDWTLKVEPAGPVRLFAKPNIIYL